MTEFHAKLYAHELTKKYASGDLDKFSSTLAEAQVELNPHQIEAALFAFHSPFSKGAILADEVGLGKTIEAGILLSQQWAERKRRIIIVVPSSLRKQWNQELLEKFYLPSLILDRTIYRQMKKEGIKNPFIQENKIVIVSHNFIKSMEKEITFVPWDLVVIDEAHRLRNVYKGASASKIANSIRRSFEGRKKILLTATPLQNSVLELYGLVSLIDEHAFGDLKSFKKQFSRVSPKDKSKMEDLQARLAPLCKRALRKDVLEYIKYTNRQPLLEEFYPTNEEIELYDKVSAYLQREDCYALPKNQRHLMTLVVRKLLASSSKAIIGTLESLIMRLEKMLGLETRINTEFDPLLDESGFEEFDDLDDGFWDDDESEIDEKEDSIKKELEELYEYRRLAHSIEEDSKYKSLLRALDLGMNKMRELGANRKAVIFTESRKTQDYLLEQLEKIEGYRDNIVVFNGTNTSKKSKEIYENWLEKHEGSDTISGSKSADKRAALVEYFKEEGKIFIATEAAAEGINLQFCSLMINYDLPWNPQKIEQRIGRCHRYGQKYDVVVINFLNKNNEADRRVLELLTEKFQLFEGVFGASDEILGTIESGVDFEKRIRDIYQKCRTQHQIKEEFDKLQEEMETEISSAISSTKKILLDNFDTEVHDKLKLTLSKSEEYLNKHNQKLWYLTKYHFSDEAIFDDDNYSFIYNDIHYKIGKAKEHHKAFRLGIDLAQDMLNYYIDDFSSAKGVVTFDYENSNKVTTLEPYIGQSGELLITKMSLKALSEEDYFIYNAITDNGELIDGEVAKKFFDLFVNSYSKEEKLRHTHILLEESSKEIESKLEEISDRNDEYFDKEQEKLDKWADDYKISITLELEELEEEIKEMKKELRKKKGREKITFTKNIREIEKKRDKKEDELKVRKKEIDKEKDTILDDLGAIYNSHMNKKTLINIRWNLK